MNGSSSTGVNTFEWVKSLFGEGAALWPDSLAATLPGMWERTITIGSAGKTFSVTGWKLGWAYGPQSLIRPLQLVHQNCVYTCSTPTQEAVAVAFEIEIQRMDTPDSYWKELSDMLQVKRDRMAAFLAAASMKPIVPDGGYFMIADFSGLSDRIDFSSEEGETKDYRFVKWLTKNRVSSGFCWSDTRLMAETTNRSFKGSHPRLFMEMTTRNWPKTWSDSVSSKRTKLWTGLRESWMSWNRVCHHDHLAGRMFTPWSNHHSNKSSDSLSDSF